MKTITIGAVITACCLASGAAVTAALMSKVEYASAKEAIGVKAEADRSACKATAGNAKDICVEEARGRENVARAELELSVAPSDTRRYEVRMVKADAAYAVANEKCDDLSGNARDVCVKEAQAAHVTAKADAKVAEKTASANATAHQKRVDANAAAREKTDVAQKEARRAINEANYGVAKEKCEALSEAAKATCIREAKTRYGQS